MKRKTAILTALIFLLCTMVTGCGSGSKAAETKSSEAAESNTIRIGVLSIADSIPLFVADQEGLFEKAGCDVEIVEFGSALDQSKAMEAGELDGMMTDMVVQCLLKKGGVDTKTVAVALGADVTEGKFYVAASPDSKVDSVEHLSGAKAAVSENTMMEFLVDSYCEELGVDIDSIEKVNVPNLSLRYEMLMEGNDIDCAIFPEPLADYAAASGAKVIIDDTTLKNNYSVSVIILKDSLIDENRKLVDGFMKAYNEAIDHLTSSPEEYKSLALNVARVPEDIKEDYQMPHYTKWAVPTEEETGRVIQWMVKKGLLTEEYPYDSIVCTEFQ